MAEPAPAPALKEILNRERFVHIAAQAEAVAPGFDRKRFLELATADLDSLSIMQRLRQGAAALQEALALPFGKAADVLDAMAPRIGHNFASIMLPEYVALYGENHFDRSMRSLAYLTRFGTSEFAIRHFLQRDLERTLTVMRRWADDGNEHVRRLASEGSRPRLPWSFQLRDLIADPSPALPILEMLKADDSLYVRKSVANHLNDIGKDHPEVLLDIISGWDREDRRTGWIVRHALRTLVKKGDARALALVGASGAAKVSVEAFAATPAKLKLGDRLSISARLASTGREAQRLVVDYAIHYVKKNGATSRKVFKLKEIDLPPAGVEALSISQTIRDFTTRKHNAGHHRVELIVNGAVLAEGGFELAA